MDKKIEHKGIIRKKHIPVIIIASIVTLSIGWLIFSDRRSSLSVDTRTLTIATAEQREFNDYIRISGSVQPITTVQISPLESGNVDQKVIEEGTMVHRGDIIVRLSNPNLAMQILEGEANLAEKENLLRNTIVSMEQEKLTLRRERLETEMTLTRQKRAYDQQNQLYSEGLISKEDYLVAKENYDIALAQRDLIYERQTQDSIYRTTQVENMEISLESMQRNMVLIRQRVDNLNVKATIDGELGRLDVVQGQYINSGAELGQINDLTNYKIEAMVDEHYIDRVTRDLAATFERGDQKFSLSLNKVFPEVRSGQFRVWLNFAGERPENIRTGQTYYINLELGSPAQGILVPRGAFYQSTGGNWIFVVEDGVAVRRPIRIGRQNPQYYEVLEGLSAGEQVIVSSYYSYGDNETLTLK